MKKIITGIAYLVLISISSRVDVRNYGHEYFKNAIDEEKIIQKKENEKKKIYMLFYYFIIDII